MSDIPASERQSDRERVGMPDEQRVVVLGSEAVGEFIRTEVAGNTAAADEGSTTTLLPPPKVRPSWLDEPLQDFRSIR